MASAVWQRRAVIATTFLALAGVLAANPQDARPVNAALREAPILTDPPDNMRLDTFRPLLLWEAPYDATQVQIQVTPFENQGPSLDLHLGYPASKLQIPAAPQWYGLLPDITYTWRVRASDAPAYVELIHPSWGPWATSHFRSPAVDSAFIAPLTPADGETVRTAMPALVFTPAHNAVYYYDLQLSKDGTFTTDPATATAPVYTALLHSGLTTPRRSYTVPAAAPLDDRTTYYWRVRPHIQGDGAPAGWSARFAFTTNFGTAPALTVGTVAVGRTAFPAASCGSTAIGDNPRLPSAVAFTDLQYAYPTTGAGRVVQQWYWNDRAGPLAVVHIATTDTCVAAAYQPLDGLPLAPGVWRLEVWSAGQLAGAGRATVIDSATLEMGGFSVGTRLASLRSCTVDDMGTSFPGGTRFLFFGWKSVGAGNYRLALYRLPEATASWRELAGSTDGPIGCGLVMPPGLENGRWRADLINEQPGARQRVQSISFSIG